MRHYLIMAARFAVKETTRKVVKYVFRGVVVAATGASIVVLEPIVGFYTASLVGPVCGGVVDYGIGSVASFAARKVDRYVTTLMGNPSAADVGIASGDSAVLPPAAMRASDVHAHSGHVFTPSYALGRNSAGVGGSAFVASVAVQPDVQAECLFRKRR